MNLPSTSPVAYWKTICTIVSLIVQSFPWFPLDLEGIRTRFLSNPPRGYQVILFHPLPKCLAMTHKLTHRSVLQGCPSTARSGCSCAQLQPDLTETITTNPSHNTEHAPHHHAADYAIAIGGPLFNKRVVQKPFFMDVLNSLPHYAPVYNELCLQRSSRLVLTPDQRTFSVSSVVFFNGQFSLSTRKRALAHCRE